MSDDAARFDEPAFRMEREQRRGGGRSGCLFGCVIGCGIAVLLAVVVVGGVLWFGYRFVSEGMSQDPAKVERWASDIVPCAIPQGYQGKFGMDFTFSGVGVKIAVIAPHEVDLEPGHAGANTHTFFVLFGAVGLDDDNAAGQFRMQRQQHNWGGRNDPPDRSTKVEIAVGGQKLPATKSEWLRGKGAGEEDEVEAIEYQIVVKPGVLFMAHGPGKDFDQKAFDAFVASIELPPAPPPPAAPKLAP